MIFEIENHRIPSHYDLHIKNFNSDELKFLIEYQYKVCIISEKNPGCIPWFLEIIYFSEGNIRIHHGQEMKYVHIGYGIFSPVCI